MCDTKCRCTRAPFSMDGLLASMLLTVLSLGTACTSDPSADRSDQCLQQTAQALAVCAKSKTFVHGIDVSVWQGTVDWAAVKGSAVQFAFARASDGLSRRDEQFAANWAGMKAHGIVRGVYQFFRPSADPLAQADLLIEMVEQAGGLDAQDLPPVIDLEVDEGLAPAVIQQRALQWVARVEQVLKRTPIVYSGANFAPSIGAACAAYPLWAPNYKTTYEGGCPTINQAWSRWMFWQWTNAGSVAGVDGDVDRNVFDGTLDELHAFIVSTHLAPPVDAGPADAGSPVDAGPSADAGPSTDAGPLPPVTPTDPRDAGEGSAMPDAGDDDMGMGMGGAGAAPKPAPTNGACE